MKRIQRNDFIGLLTVISLVMLGASYGLRDNWWGDLLLQLGSGVLVLAPFLLITRWIEEQLTKSAEETIQAVATTQVAVKSLESEFRVEQEFSRAEMARTSADIDALIADRLDDEHKPDRQLYEGIAKAPSRADVVSALHRALEQRIIASFGVRVEIGGSTGLYLWFRPDREVSVDDDPLLITVQTWDLVTVMDLHWDPGVGVVEFLLDLGAKLKETEHWTGDGGFSPGESLEALSALLIAGQKAIIGGVPERHTEVFEVVEDWTVGERHLTYAAHLQPYEIRYRDLNDFDWQRHMREKLWVNMRTFQEALDVAICLIADGHAEGALPSYLPGVWQNRRGQEKSAVTDD